MQTSVTGLALIGRSFPSDAYQALIEAYVVSRAEKRSARPQNAIQNARQNAWHRPLEGVTLPKRLFH